MVNLGFCFRISERHKAGSAQLPRWLPRWQLYQNGLLTFFCEVMSTGESMKFVLMETKFGCSEAHRQEPLVHVVLKMLHRCVCWTQQGCIRRNESGSVQGRPLWNSVPQQWF